MTNVAFKGIAASEGIAIGAAFKYSPPKLTISDRVSGSFDQEHSRFLNACEQARKEIRGIRDRLASRSKGADLAAIFDAHEMILDDPLLISKVSGKLQEGAIVERAVQEATQELADLLSGMEDEMFAARAADILDVGRRVLRILLEVPDTSLQGLSTPAIIIAHDLTPSDTASLNPELALGFCTAAGGLTSHSVIVARSLDIPAVVGLGDEFLQAVKTGDPLLMDGEEGVLLLQPDKGTLTAYQERKRARKVWLSEIKSQAHENTFTRDGRRVEVAANIGDLNTAQNAVEFGAEGIGLLRTEFLYLNETKPPDEAKQISIYRPIFEVMGNRPVIVRTLDIGGDKPPSYLPFPSETNPFLGWRAIRYCLENPSLFKTQLRAILRAAVGFDIRIMFPMVVDIEELQCGKGLIESVKNELDREGLPYAENVPVGIMIETPAAAVMVDVLAEEADFFSLGTNDLTQYTLAVDRINEKVSQLYQPLHPAVLRLIRQSIEVAHKKNKWIGMCGELAGMRKAIPILIGMGLDEFSMAPPSIPAAKDLIRRLSAEKARQIADTALSSMTAQEIDDYMQAILKELDSESK